jgi:hypothetical protein
VNLTERALERQADRLVAGIAGPEGDGGLFESETVEETKARAKMITAADYGIEESCEGPKLGNVKRQLQVEADVAKLVGMEHVKEYFQTMKTKALYVEQGGDMKTLRTCMNMVLTGNPGELEAYGIPYRWPHGDPSCMPSSSTQALARPRSRDRLQSIFTHSAYYQRIDSWKRMAW